jgi:hypothetical protein
MKHNYDSYRDFQDSIFQEIGGLRNKFIANEFIKLAFDAGISQDELCEIIRSSKDQDGDDILNALHIRIDAKKK